MRAGNRLSPVINAQQSNRIDAPAFYRCHDCGKSIPPRRFTRKSLEKRKGVLCACGGKLFRYENNPSMFRQIVMLIFHPSLIVYTNLCPKPWRKEVSPYGKY